MTKSIHFSLVKKFINLLMIAGKKNAAYKIFSFAINDFVLAVEKKKLTKYAPIKQMRKPQQKGKITNDNDNIKFLSLLEKVINNIQPSLEGKKCRIGGSTKIVPAIVTKKRGSILAMRWIIESARKRKEKSKKYFSQCLTEEFLDAYQKQGRPRQRRDEYHKTCQASRGYLRYRWW